MSTIFDIPGTNPPNQFSPIIEQYLARNSSTSPTDRARATAKTIVEHVTASADPGNALFQLWDAFFNSVVQTPFVNNNASLSFQYHLDLLYSIRAHSPTRPTHPAVKAGSYRESKLLTSGHLQLADSGSYFDWKTLPLFPAQWRDTHDILEAWRSWDGSRRVDGGHGMARAIAAPKATCNPAELYTRFVTFSAVLVQRQFETKTDGHGILVHPIWVFYAARKTLETDHPGGHRPGDGEDREVITREGHLAPEQLWQLDVRVAAIWLRYGARALWETDAADLRDHYAATLNWATDLWKGDGDFGKGGISKERWRFWAKRLRIFLGGSNQLDTLDEESRQEIEEARRVMEGLLLKKDL